MKPEEGWFDRLTTHGRPWSARPLAASSVGFALFLLGCGGLWAFPTGAAVGLLAPAVAWEAVAFGPAAAFAAAAMATVAAVGILGPGGYWTASICALAAVQIGLVNVLIWALSRKADVLRCRRAAAKPTKRSSSPKPSTGSATASPSSVRRSTFKPGDRPTR